MVPTSVLPISCRSPCAEHHPPRDLALLIPGQGRLQDSQGCLHRLAPDDQVGQKVFAAGKQFTHVIHAFGETLVDASQRIEPLAQGLFGQFLCILWLALYYCLGQLVEQFL
jgi:hypothetical protein